MSRIYLPTTGAHEWQWLLARPAVHWKHGASAMALADAWENADPWPDRVANAGGRDEDLSDLDLLLALPEHEVPLPGGRRRSQTDLFVLARKQQGELVTIAVEGKAQEPGFRSWRAHGDDSRARSPAFPGSSGSWLVAAVRKRGHTLTSNGVVKTAGMW